MKKCSIEGCDRRYEAKGFCKSHYYRNRKYGDPLATPVISKTAISGEDRYRTIEGAIHKLCGVCIEYLPMNIEHFYRTKRNKIDDYNTYCIPCTIQKYKNWVEDNPEKHKEVYTKRYAKQDVKDRLVEHNKTRRKSGKELEWQRENKDKVKLYREAHSQNKKHDISENELEMLYEYASNACMYCGRTEKESLEIFKQKLHRDHVVNEGSNKIDNCVLACKSCNGSKHEADWEEWYIDSKVYSNSRHERIIYWLKNWQTIINKDNQI